MCNASAIYSDRLRRSHLIFLIVVILIRLCPAQGTLDRNNVFELDSSLTPDAGLLKEFSAQNILLVGEMHGTSEPVRFMTQTAIALSQTHNVKVGFELPVNEAVLLHQDPTGKTLSRSVSFSERNDGRGSEAWLNAMAQLKKTKNTDVFFFDVLADDPRERDSVLFLNVLEQRKKDSTAIIITISGNIHNRLQPYKHQKTMAWYLSHYSSAKLLCINHRYDRGSMYNSVGDTEQLREVTGAGGVLTTLSSTPDYFYLDRGMEFSQAWNAFLFTTKINAAFPVKNK